MHNQARRSGAFLTGATEGPAQSGRYANIQITIIHDRQGVLRSHFHLNFGQITNGGNGDLFAHIDRTGEADRVHFGAFHQPLADGAAGAHNQIE